MSVNLNVLNHSELTMVEQSYEQIDELSNKEEVKAGKKTNHSSLRETMQFRTSNTE